MKFFSCRSAVIPEFRQLVLAAVLIPFAAPLPAAELRLTQGTNISADINAADGRVLTDLLGSIWLIPARGGDARRLVDANWQARAPRWSPDGTSALFASNRAGGSSLWRIALADDVPERITPAIQVEQDGAWHPTGEQIVFAAARHDSGLDIWQRDLTTGVASRLTDHAGDESSPAWSADGRHLIYRLYEGNRWYLMLKRWGQLPQILHESARPIYAPAWRPDNTLISFLAQNEVGLLDLMILIPADPPLARVYASGEDFFASPVAWRDRSRFIYAADGVIKWRHFEDRKSRTLPFSAAVGKSERWTQWRRHERPLPNTKPLSGSMVIRASRLFDGESDQYRHSVDIVIENGRIAAIEEQRDRGDVLVIDIPDSTALPGLIDSYGALPANLTPALGSRILAFGVTTLVSPDLSPEQARTTWHAAAQPGPRLLTVAAVNDASSGDARAFVRAVQIPDSSGFQIARSRSISMWRQEGLPLLAANWNSGLLAGADMLLGTATFPTSPSGRHYDDVLKLADGRQMLLVSGAAGRTTPGLGHLQQTPQGRSLQLENLSGQGIAGEPGWLAGSATVIVGSRPSGLPAGFATQAELLALLAVGMSPRDVLVAATSGAADALGAGGEIGRLQAGSRADLVLVTGDPLRRLADVGEVIAVVRDGRFYSAARLLQDATPQDVE
ncbi:MAG: amidohydrolase family protein [Woeseia sp.]|nr:amidohydrolase family protein [Woeseia sp.]